MADELTFTPAELREIQQFLHNTSFPFPLIECTPPFSASQCFEAALFHLRFQIHPTKRLTIEFTKTPSTLGTITWLSPFAYRITLPLTELQQSSLGNIMQRTFEKIWKTIPQYIPAISFFEQSQRDLDLLLPLLPQCVAFYWEQALFVLRVISLIFNEDGFFMDVEGVNYRTGETTQFTVGHSIEYLQIYRTSSPIWHERPRWWMILPPEIQEIYSHWPMTFGVQIGGYGGFGGSSPLFLYFPDFLEDHPLKSTFNTWVTGIEQFLISNRLFLD